MKLELEEYRAESAHLKNQQATIRRLEERNRQLEQQVCSKVTLFTVFFKLFVACMNGVSVIIEKCQLLHTGALLYYIDFVYPCNCYI
jgi:hypothetical protein